MKVKYKPLRQTVVCVVATLVVLSCIGVWSAAASEPAQAVVARFDSLLLTTMKQGPELTFDGRYAKLAERIDQDFDIPRMARRRLGDRWARLSMDKQQAYIARLRKALIARYARTYNRYAGQHFEVCGLRTLGPDSRQVEVALIAPDGMRQVTRYTVAREAGAWRVVGVSPAMGFTGRERAARMQRDTPQALFGWLDRDLERGQASPRV